MGHKWLLNRKCWVCLPYYKHKKGTRRRNCFALTPCKRSIKARFCLSRTMGKVNWRSVDGSAPSSCRETSSPRGQELCWDSGGSGHVENFVESRRKFFWFFFFPLFFPKHRCGRKPSARKCVTRPHSWLWIYLIKNGFIRFSRNQVWTRLEAAWIKKGCDVQVRSRMLNKNMNSSLLVYFGVKVRSSF